MNYEGRTIRLTPERLAHILEHPEMAGLEQALEETVVAPQQVVQSRNDPQVKLYYRHYLGTRVGDKYLCIVVKETDEDSFVITAYLTDRINRGTLLWPRNT